MIFNMPHLSNAGVLKFGNPVEGLHVKHTFSTNSMNQTRMYYGWYQVILRSHDDNVIEAIKTLQ